MSPHGHDDAMRKETRDTLRANPEASYETVLGNWRYQRNGTVDKPDAARLRTILEEERGALAERLATHRHQWWRRMWQRAARGQ